jgi:hypothetical protein
VEQGQTVKFPALENESWQLKNADGSPLYTMTSNTDQVINATVSGDTLQVSCDTSEEAFAQVADADNDTIDLSELEQSDLSPEELARWGRRRAWRRSCGCCCGRPIYRRNWRRTYYRPQRYYRTYRTYSQPRYQWGQPSYRVVEPQYQEVQPQRQAPQQQPRLIPPQPIEGGERSILTPPQQPQNQQPQQEPEELPLPPQAYPQPGGR